MTDGVPHAIPKICLILVPDWLEGVEGLRGWIRLSRELLVVLDSLTDLSEFVDKVVDSHRRGFGLDEGDLGTVLLEHAVEQVELDDTVVENRTGLLEFDRGIVDPREVVDTPLVGSLGLLDVAHESLNSS